VPSVDFESRDGHLTYTKETVVFAWCSVAVVYLLFPL
jgi:hypothetical protein